mmetsp:Transcript_1902/g.2856  ORF Transcript_1902/g.2856 Transcript_1902/m.2856 type:complete len:1374 (-) Transcript_1902:146-4267(-)
MLQDAKGQKSRSRITTRRGTLLQHFDLFSSLSAVLKRATNGPLRTGGTRSSRMSKNSSRNSRNSFSARGRSRDREISKILERVEEAYENQERLITTLVLMGYGEASQLRASLKICVQAIKDKRTRSIDGSHRSGTGARRRGMFTASSLVLYTLSDAVTEEISEQIARIKHQNQALSLRHSTNSIKMDKETKSIKSVLMPPPVAPGDKATNISPTSYTVILLGISVNAEELGFDRLHGQKKSQLLTHQQVSSSQFIQSLFGVCNTPTAGWIKLTERVSFNLGTIFEGTVNFISAVHSEKTHISSKSEGKKNKKNNFPNNSVRTREHLSEKLQMRISLGIAGGLRALHNADSFHGNLKPSAVGLDDGFRVKLLDFGSTPRLPDAHSLEGAYYAPEFYTKRLLTGLPKSETLRKADVYSCGAVIVELFSSERRRLRSWLPPDLIRSFKNVEKMTRSKKREAPSFDVSSILERPRPDLSGFLSHCVCISAEHRPEIKKVALALSKMLSTDQETIYLDSFESQTINSQLETVNKIKSNSNCSSYRVYLAGIPVHVRVLGDKSMDQNLLKCVKTTMQLCEHPSFLNFFGCSRNKKHGWIVATELIENTLPDLLDAKATPPDFRQRLQIALELVDGICEFHANCNEPYYLTQSSIFVTSDFKVKLSPYAGGHRGIPCHITDEKKISSNEVVSPTFGREPKSPADFSDYVLPPEISPRGFEVIDIISPRAIETSNLSLTAQSTHELEAGLPNSPDTVFKNNSPSNRNSNTDAAVKWGNWSRKSDIFVLAITLLEWLPEFRETSMEVLLRSRGNSGGNNGERGRANSLTITVGRSGSPVELNNALSASKTNLLKHSHSASASQFPTSQLEGGSTRSNKRRNSSLLSASTVLNSLQRKPKTPTHPTHKSHGHIPQLSAPALGPTSMKNLLTVPGTESVFCGGDFSELLVRCLDKNHSKRPTAEEVRDHLVSEIAEDNERMAPEKSVSQLGPGIEGSSRRPNRPGSPKSRSQHHRKTNPSRSSLPSQNTLVDRKTPITIDRKTSNSSSRPKIKIRSRGWGGTEMEPSLTAGGASVFQEARPDLSPVIGGGHRNSSDGSFGRLIGRRPHVTREMSERSEILHGLGTSRGTIDGGSPDIRSRGPSGANSPARTSKQHSDSIKSVKDFYLSMQQQSSRSRPTASKTLQRTWTTPDLNGPDSMQGGSPYGSEIVSVQSSASGRIEEINQIRRRGRSPAKRTTSTIDLSPHRTSNLSRHSSAERRISSGSSAAVQAPSPLPTEMKQSASHTRRRGDSQTSNSVSMSEGKSPRIPSPRINVSNNKLSDTWKRVKSKSSPSLEATISTGTGETNNSSTKTSKNASPHDDQNSKPSNREKAFKAVLMSSKQS